MVGVPSDILDFCASILKSDFQSVDIPRLKVKPLYLLIEKLPFLTVLVEFEVALLLNKALAGFGIGTYDERFYIIISRWEVFDYFIPATSNAECDKD